MERIKVRTLRRPSESFIDYLFGHFESDFPTYFVPSFAKYYFGRSGNKWIGGMAMSEMDEYSLVDDDGDFVDVTTDSIQSGVINDFSGYYEDLGNAVGDTYYYKWHSVFASLQNAYGKDFYDLDDTEETITNDLKDSKEYSHSKNTKTASSLTTTNTKSATDNTTSTGKATSSNSSSSTGSSTQTDTPNLTTTETRSVTAYNTDTFSDTDKTITAQTGTDTIEASSSDSTEGSATTDTEGTNNRTINDTTTITAVGSADDNHSDSTDTGNDATTHTGTRTRHIKRTGGNDVWQRAEAYNRYVSTIIYRDMANDIDKIITLPYYE